MNARSTAGRSSGWSLARNCACVGEKVDGLKLPALLGLFAFLFLQAGVVILGMTVYMTLVSRLGPLLAGIVAVLLLVGIAAGLGWYAARRLKDLA